MKTDFEFEAAGGSIVGRDHVGRGSLLVGKNNQDAFAIHQTDTRLAAVVCDGCSSSRYSEVGARLASTYLSRRLCNISDLEVARLSLLNYMADIVVLDDGADESVARFVSGHLLFTIVGCLIEPKRIRVFSIGDGVWAAGLDLFDSGDGAYSLQRIGPFPGNAPPYLGYDLLDRDTPFTIHFDLATEQVDSLIIGSDGVADLAEAAGSPIPGRTELVGPVGQFSQRDEYFRPDGIRRRLALINSEVVRVEDGRIVRYPGLLPDDTTLVAIRRRKAAD